MLKNTILLTIIYCASNVLYAQKTEKKEITWYTFSEAMAKVKEEPRPLLIDVFTDWCGYCRRMDAQTFGDTAIANYVSQHFYAVKFNAEGHEKITYRDTVWTNVNYENGGKKGTHSLAQFLLNGQMSYPTIVYMEPSSKMIAPVMGYMTPSEIEPILLYFGESIYKTNNVFEAFAKGLNAKKIIKK